MSASKSHKNSMIEACNITRKYGHLLAVKDLSFQVAPGEVFALLGPNGAGKTTTVRILACLIAPTGGSAYVGGLKVGRDNSKIRQIIGVLPENPGLYQKLSAWQNLEFFASLYQIADPKSSIEKYLDLLDLTERKYAPVGTFSKGMRQKVAIARALINEPKVLFLDEPTASLDPKSSKLVREFIEKLSQQEKRTIVLCTHNLAEAESLCDRIGLIDQSLIKMGAPEDLKGDLYEKRTVIQLKELTPKVKRSLDFDFITEINPEDSKIIVTVDNPEEQNPLLVEKIVRAGGKIQWVNKKEYSLEDVYLRLMEADKNDS